MITIYLQRSSQLCVIALQLQGGGVEQPLAAPKSLVTNHMDVMAVGAVAVPFTG